MESSVTPAGSRLPRSPPDGGDNFTAVSVYAISKGTIGHDAAAHRILSDLSALLR